MEKYLDKNSVLRLLQGIKTQIDKSKTNILDTKGVANGIASLDANGNVPLSQLGNVDTDIHEIALELPTQLTEKQSKHIFLVPRGVDEKTNKNIYKEYIFTGSDITNVKDTDWEQLGEFTTSVDLNDYSKKSETTSPSSFRFKRINEGGELALLYTDATGKEFQVKVPRVNSGNENDGLMTALDKLKLDEIDLNALTESINDANTAANNTNKAIQAAETATTGAETCNVELSGSTISVTNRNGETKSVDVINTDEEVTVTISSSVNSINVAGIKINVFLNNGKTPQSYTTNSEGKATFTIDRGNYYQVVFPEYGNAQPIAPVGYTAVLGSRNINVEYLPYDEETSEKVIVTVTKYTDGNGTPWEGKEVIVTIDNKATTYTTDEKGQATIYVPYLKEYTVRVDDEDGYYVRFNKNSRTYTSRVAQRLIQVNMYQFKTGIYVLDNDATEYYIEDWVAAGKSAEEAVAIKVADQNLRLNRGTFIIRCGDLKDMTKLQKYQWCTQNLQFTSIALNGNTSSDPNYWNGEQSSFLVRQEAEERSLSVPAFAFAYGQSLEIGGEKLNGFLMSVGQEYVHISNAGTIREVLRTLFGDSVADAYYKFVNGQSRWTSTQGSAASAWGDTSPAGGNYDKNGSCYVLPVFAC